MIAYADASFLVALFTFDEHRTRAWKWWRANKICPVVGSRLTVFETENTFRAQRAGGLVTGAEERDSLAALEAALRDGLLLRRETPPYRLYPEAHRLSQFHSRRAAYGALDILHIAAAAILKADTVLTFDNGQRTLATAAGIRVAPEIRLEKS